LDMSCNVVRDVSGIYFCDGTYIGHGASFDISSNSPIVLQSSSGISVSGPFCPSGGICDASGTTGSANQVLYSGSGAPHWINLPIVWASFSSTQNQQVTDADTTLVLTTDTENVTPIGIQGWTAGTSSIVIVPSIGTTCKLKIIASLVLDSDTNNNTKIRFWIRKNGMNIPNTSSIHVVKNTSEFGLVTSEWFVNWVSGDALSVCLQSDRPGARILAESAGGSGADAYPATPSILLTLLAFANY
jgi:hypothetical protein